MRCIVPNKKEGLVRDSPVIFHNKAFCKGVFTGSAGVVIRLVLHEIIEMVKRRQNMPDNRKYF